VTERADGAQVEDFQGWGHGRTPFSSSATVRRDAFVIECSGDIVRKTLRCGGTLHLSSPSAAVSAFASADRLKLQTHEHQRTY
jgi:hypothetical protein